MQYTIKFCFSCIFLFGIFLNSNAIVHKGDSLFASGQFFEASIEYERLIYNSKNPVQINYNKYKKALCYKKLMNFTQALEELQSIYFPNTNDSLFQRVYYQESLCFYLNGEPSKAIWKIDEYLNQNKDSIASRLFLPLKILCLNETYQWTDARQCFTRYIHLQNFNLEKQSSLQIIVDDLYKRKNLPHIRSAKKAENWSRFIPGSGQIYAGKTGEGIINFLINASLLTFSAHQALNGFYITGYLAGLGFFNKTYQGGIKRSGILAIQKNKEILVNFNSKINETIRSNFEMN